MKHTIASSTPADAWANVLARARTNAPKSAARSDQPISAAAAISLSDQAITSPPIPEANKPYVDIVMASIYLNQAIEAYTPDMIGGVDRVNEMLRHAEAAVSAAKELIALYGSKE